MMPQTALLVGILVPLVVACLTPFLANRPVWRDVAGPIGGVVTFIAALQVARAVQAGETPSLFVAQIADGLAINFAVTPLGAIFGLVASGLWISPGCIPLDTCGGPKKNTKHDLPPFMPWLFMRQWQLRGLVIFWFYLFFMKF